MSSRLAGSVTPNLVTPFSMQSKIKVHDGIVGLIILASIVLGLKADPAWFYVAGVIGALMVSSAFTGFCPVYFVLNKLMPSSDSKP